MAAAGSVTSPRRHVRAPPPAGGTQQHRPGKARGEAASNSSGSAGPAAKRLRLPILWHEKAPPSCALTTSSEATETVLTLPHSADATTADLQQRCSVSASATFGDLPQDFLVMLVEEHLPFDAKTVASVRLVNRALRAAVHRARGAGAMLVVASTDEEAETSPTTTTAEAASSSRPSSAAKNASTFPELRPLLRLMPSLQRIDFTLWTKLSGPELAEITRWAPHLRELRIHMPREDARMPHPGTLSGDDVGHAIQRLDDLTDLDLSHVFSMTGQLYSALVSIKQRLSTLTLGRTHDKIPVAHVVDLQLEEEEEVEQPMDITGDGGNGEDAAWDDGAAAPLPLEQHSNDEEYNSDSDDFVTAPTTAALTQEEENSVDDESTIAADSQGDGASISHMSGSNASFSDHGFDNDSNGEEAASSPSLAAPVVASSYSVLHSIQALSFWRPNEHLNKHPANVGGWYAINARRNAAIVQAAEDNATLIPLVLCNNSSTLEKLACVDLPAVPRPDLWFSNWPRRFERLTKLQLLNAMHFTHADAEGLFGRPGSCRVPALQFLELSGAFNASLVSTILGAVSPKQLRAVMLVGCESIDDEVLSKILCQHGETLEVLYLGHRLTNTPTQWASLYSDVLQSTILQAHGMQAYDRSRMRNHGRGDDAGGGTSNPPEPLVALSRQHMHAVSRYWRNVSIEQLVRLIADSPRLKTLHVESLFATGLVDLPLIALAARAAACASSGRVDALAHATFIRPVLNGDAVIASMRGDVPTGCTAGAIKVLTISHAVVLGGDDLEDDVNLSPMPSTHIGPQMVPAQRVGYFDKVEALNLTYSSFSDAHLGAMLIAMPRIRHLFVNRCGQLRTLHVASGKLSVLEVVQAVACKQLRSVRINSCPRLQYVWLRGSPERAAHARARVLAGPVGIAANLNNTRRLNTNGPVTMPPVRCGQHVAIVLGPDGDGAAEEEESAVACFSLERCGPSAEIYC